jgi:membrane fusion protein, multidrug efflux system
VRVQLRLTTLKGAAVVPSEAVQTGQDGQFVFVVKADSTVEQRSIVSGDAAGEDVVVQKGLQPGDRVVTQGQLRLEPGSRVQTGEGRGGGRGQAGAAPNRQGRGQRAQ